MANVRPQGAATPVAPARKKLRLSEGTRSELEYRGHAISPFTGALLVGSGNDDVREVSREEYDRVAKEAALQEKEDREGGTSNLL